MKSRRSVIVVAIWMAFGLSWAIIPPNTVVFYYGQSLVHTTSATPVLSVAEGNNALIADNLVTQTFPTTSGGVTGGLWIGDFPDWTIIAATETESEKPRAAAANVYYELTGRSLLSIAISGGGYSYAQLTATTGSPTDTRLNWLYHSIEAVGAHLPYAQCIGVVFIHGEQDEINGTSAATYKAALQNLQSQLQAKIRAATNCRGVVPLYTNTSYSWTKQSLTTSPVALGVYQAIRDNPGIIINTTPKYIMTYNVDGVHTDNAGTQLNGIQIGRALAVGPTWKGTFPTAVTLTDSTHVTVTLNVPTCPIVVDTTYVTLLGAARGFEYFCSSSPPSITAVDCSATCTNNVGTCVLTLSGATSGACQTTDVVRYAYTGTGGNSAGRSSGARGNIRDSDALGTNYYSWLLTFEESVQ